MRSPALRMLVGVTVSLAATACDLSTPTEVQVPVDLELDFCANDVPVWFAYQNQQGGGTIRVIPDASGTVRFTATNRVVLGMVWQDGSDYHTEIVYATNRELESMSARACLEEFGTKTANGTVSGFGAGQLAVVGMSFASALLQPGNTSYSLENLADRPLDLVASRQAVTGNQRSADRVVIRRTQTFVNNGTIPVVDFAASEALQPATATAEVSGIFTGEFAYVQNNFFSQLETSHSLSHTEGIANGGLSFVSVPSTALAVGDYHDLILLAVDAAEGGVRGAENFFRAAVNQTLALGPPLEQPDIDEVPNDEYVRLRLQLPLQLSYDDAVSVVYRQQHDFSARTVSLWATLEYLRAVVGVWQVVIPDLTGLDGWQDAWGLQPEAGIDWTVTAFGGRSELMFGAKPEDGEFIRYAIRHSIPTPALHAQRNAGARPLPRMVSRNR